MSTALTTKMQSIGNEMLRRAKEQFSEEQQQKVVEETKDVLRKIAECERTLVIARKGLAHFRAQKKAIESGEFSFSVWRSKILYKDEKLNRSYQEGI